MDVRIIKFSDIMKHPKLSLSMKDYFEKVNIQISQKKEEELQGFLDLEKANLYELKIAEDSVVETFTAKFSDGFEADIKVCAGTENFYIDPVLFYDNGYEACVLETYDELLGEYIFECNGKEYVVNLILQKDNSNIYN